MKRTLGCFLLLLPLLSLAIRPAEASVFSKKSTPRPDPAARVPELLYFVTMDADERKRAAAADELRGYDVKQFPEILPILCDVLEHDKSSAVRLEAAQSLGKIRPVSEVVGQALEQASAKDPAFRVRMQAWTSLKMYRLAGYRSSPVKDKQEFQIQVLDANGKEKTIVIDSPQAPLATQETPALNAFPLKSAAKNNPPPWDANSLPRPMPVGPGFSTAIPTVPERVTPPPGRINPDDPNSDPFP